MEAPIGEARRLAGPIGLETDKAGIVDGGTTEVEYLGAIAARVLDGVPEEQASGVHAFEMEVGTAVFVADVAEGFDVQECGDGALVLVSDTNVDAVFAHAADEIFKPSVRLRRKALAAAREGHQLEKVTNKFGRAADFADEAETFGAADAILHRRFVKLTEERVGVRVELQTVEQVFIAALEASGLKNVVEGIVNGANFDVVPIF